MSREGFDDDRRSPPARPRRLTQPRSTAGGLLKARGCRWRPRRPTSREAWWRDASVADHRAEAESLDRQIHRLPAPLRTARLTARDRHRPR